MRWMKCYAKPKTARLDSLRRAWMHFLEIDLLFLTLLCRGALCQDTTLHSQSNVVVIPALVKNAQGEAEYGLTAKDFVVDDDGEEQAVHLDEAAEGQAVSMVIAIQRGRRAGYEFPRV